MKKAIYAFLFSIMFVLSGCYGNGGGAGDDTDNEDEVVEVFGCIDETAINFNPEANTDDSSCEYINTQSCRSKCNDSFR